MPSPSLLFSPEFLASPCPGVFSPSSIWACLCPSFRCPYRSCPRPSDRPFGSCPSAAVWFRRVRPVGLHDRVPSQPSRGPSDRRPVSGSVRALLRASSRCCASLAVRDPWPDRPRLSAWPCGLVHLRLAWPPRLQISLLRSSPATVLRSLCADGSPFGAYHPASPRPWRHSFYRPALSVRCASERRSCPSPLPFSHLPVSPLGIDGLAFPVGRVLPLVLRLRFGLSGTLLILRLAALAFARLRRLIGLPLPSLRSPAPTWLIGLPSLASPCLSSSDWGDYRPCPRLSACPHQAAACPCPCPQPRSFSLAGRRSCLRLRACHRAGWRYRVWFAQLPCPRFGCWGRAWTHSWYRCLAVADSAPRRS